MDVPHPNFNKLKYSPVNFKESSTYLYPNPLSKTMVLVVTLWILSKNENAFMYLSPLFCL